MRSEEGKISDINIAYIGGGSRGWAWNLMGDLAVEEALSGTVKLYDLNFDAAYNNEIIGNRITARADAKGKWKYIAVDTLDDALAWADFVVISILPGTFHEMESDVHEPEKYGIYQSVGDTVGPGGLVRALRTIPMFVEIAEGIKRSCPGAWVINYTNPMTLCTRTLYEVFPEIKAFGCCHEVFGTQKLLAEMLKDMNGIEGVTRDEIKVNVLGINHFTWLDSASYQNTDLMPVYHDFVEKYYNSGFQGEENDHWMNGFFSSAQRVKFDLFKQYGIVAAAGDRHLAEFMPPRYLKNPETVNQWMFRLTPVSWRFEHQEELIEKSKRLASGEEEVELKESGEEGLKQIKAILGLGEFVTNVNLPNQGQIKGIPIGAVVETNALFSRNSIRPVIAGELPAPVQALVIRHVMNQETILKAALTRDKKLAFSAFLNDPLVNVDAKAGKELFDRMLRNTLEFLLGWEI